MDFLSVGERAAILSDVAGIVDDTHISLAITYRDFQSVSRTPSTGANTPVFTDVTTRAIRSELTASQVRAGAGLYEIGDVEFFIAQSDLSGITPFRQDEVVCEGTTFKLMSWKGDALGAFWRIIGRRVA